MKKVEKCYYDFHIHTCLSPCGGEDNTPNNVVNMAKLLGFDVIAITDHNTCGNVRACQKVAEKVGIIVIAGMEVTTSEDIHVVCLFDEVEKAERFEEIIIKRTMAGNNDEKIFGEQIKMNENDEVVGHESRLLIYGVDIGIYDISLMVKESGGICFPAHIFREGSGILPILGGIDKDMGFCMLEKGLHGKLWQIEEAGYHDYFVLDNSDAHYLEHMIEAKNFLRCEKSVGGVFDFFHKVEARFRK